MIDPAHPDLPLPLVLAIDLGFAALRSPGSRETLVVSPSRDLVPELITRAVERAPVTVVVADGGARSETAPSRYQHVLWIAPDRGQWRHSAVDLDRALVDGGLLVVVGRGPLTSLQSRMRADSLPFIDGAVDGRRIQRTLGYEVVGWWKLGGLRSAAWAVLRVVASRLRRPDLVDRCEAAYRLELVEPTDATLWSLGVWVARKPAPS